MRIRSMLTVLVVSAVLCGVALAVPPGRTLTFDKSPMGKVVFDGTIHQEAGFKCADCHNEKMFPKMKQGTVKITMAKIYAGELCGVCHNGGRAFAAQGNCARCHKR